MSLSIPIPVKSNGDGEPIDWSASKAAILARLNVIEEYEKLGVKFPNKQRGGKDRCWVSCYAVGRDDNVASAAVHADNGIYIDKGGDGLSKGFFNFALENGRFGTWMECFRHYADQAGVDLGRVERGGNGNVLEAVHEYRDAAGNLRYGVFKYRLPKGDKTFRQYPWRDDQWVKERGCMEGVDPLPYRLPEIAEGRDTTILWTEGERDVDRAFGNGFLATTSHMGAGNFANTGRRFIAAGLLPLADYAIIPDNDQQGRAYALDVATALREYLPAECTVRVVPLPDLPHKGDLSDWFDLGGTADELRALIAAAPAWEPGQPVEEPKSEESASDPGSRLCTVADLRKAMSGSAWTWDKWIANSALTALAAEAGTGKTRWLFDLHRRAYHGLSWPDGTTMNLPPGGKVLWIAADSQHQEMCDIPAEFGIPDEAVYLNTVADDPYGGTGLQTVDDLADFERNINLVRPYWAVIDTITNTGDFKSHTTDDAKRQYEPLQKIALRTQTPIICVTHTNAAGKTIGRRVHEKVRTVIMLLHPDKDQPNRRRLWVEKSKAIKPPPLGVTMGDSGNEYDFSPPEEAEKPGATEKPGAAGRAKSAEANKEGECIKWIEDYAAAGACKVAEIKNDSVVAGFSDGTFWRARRAAREGGLIREFDSGGNKWMELDIQPELKPYPSASRNGGV